MDELGSGHASAIGSILHAQSSPVFDQNHHDFYCGVSSWLNHTTFFPSRSSLAEVAPSTSECGGVWRLALYRSD